MPGPIRRGTTTPTAPVPTGPATTTPSGPAAGPTTPAWSPRTTPTPAVPPARLDSTPPGSPANAQASVRLDAELFLSSSGHFVTRARQDKPLTAPEMGDALLQASRKTEDGVNVFANPAITLEQKQAALTALTEAFTTGTDPANFGGNGNQALQTRASAAPLLLDLATSLDPSKPDQKALQGKALDGYLKMLDAEPHGQLRTFMLYDLDRARPKLPDAVKPTVEKLMRETAPLTPPYEDWFKNGNTKLKLDYYVGDTFWAEETGAYVSAGFKRTDNADGTATMTKHMEAQRQLNDGTTQKYVTDVEILMHNGTDGMFDKMNDPSVQGVVYSGHANYGREVPSHLAAGPATMSGSKVFFALQCGGKGIHNALLEKYPDLQMVSSKNSSYGYQDRKTLLNTLDGISKRLPWSQISTQNAAANSDNYYFPSDTLIGQRAVDRDRDGRADAWDRVLDVDPFHPQADIAKQLTPTAPGRPAEDLDGHAVQGAVQRFWRMAGYNQWAEPLKDQGVVADGYYAGKKTDPMFKVTDEVGPDGAPVKRLQVNQFYAHASEETLGAAMHYELGRAEAKKAGLTDADSKGAGLLMAAKALDIDTSDHDEDSWKALLQYAGLPAAVPYSDAMAANHQDEEYSAGGAATLKTFMDGLKAKHLSL